MGNKNPNNLDIVALRELTLADLAEKEAEHRKELFNLRFQKVLAQTQNPMRIRKVRRDLARILTVAQMKKKAESC